MEDRFEIFTTSIAKINRNIRRIKTEEMQEYGLKSPHVSCLYYLFKHENPLTAKQLSELCDEDKGALSRSIEFLEKNDYIICNSRTEKRYNSPISLTKKGVKVAEEIVVKIDKILDLASEGLTEANRKIFYQSLTLISNNLQNLTDNYKI